MKNAFISYYTHLIKLNAIANKNTMFLAHMLTMMRFDAETKQNVVSMNARVKRKIMEDIGSTSKDVLKGADQYLNILKKAGMIKSVGGGDFIIDPEDYGYAKYVSQELRLKSKAIYCSYEFTENGIKEIHKVESEDGEMHDIGVRQNIDEDVSHFIDDNGERHDFD